MTSASIVPQADLAFAIMVAIPLGLAALVILVPIVLTMALAAWAAAQWALGRGDAVVRASLDQR
jgi:hypothetical protein